MKPDQEGKQPAVHHGNEKASSAMETKLMATAYHEAGHAVMAVSLGRSVHKISIIPKQSTFSQIRLGGCKMGSGRSKATKDLLEDEVLILYAGMVAESQFTGEYCALGARQDLMSIERLLCTRANSQRQFEKLQKRMLDKTEYLLSEKTHADAIKRIANELVVKKTISGRAVRHFFNQATESN